MKTIHFINPMTPYIVGDEAAFDDKLADQIIEKGYAEEVINKAKKGDNNGNNNKGQS